MYYNFRIRFLNFKINNSNHFHEEFKIGPIEDKVGFHLHYTQLNTQKCVIDLLNQCTHFKINIM
jgi:hypothetical protein